ncbi:Glucokinase [Corynebacterium occultum]|uniref:Glucokinase n=1 Tax=Corynebacterium occultum TaxID=2675219 RepID=A0A6B8W6N8_9CORY|nr:ROK family protein [Corynebacterium occultum]QGU08281.1 Glucokinase [Corynebacterium occultum]
MNQDPATPWTLALDIGATKIAYGLIPDTHPLQAHHTGTVPTQPPGGDPLTQVEVAVRQALETSGIIPTRVGVGAPGIIETPGGLVRYNGDTIPGWAGTDLGEVISRQLKVPVACHNDVRIWAYGEQLLGAGREFPTGRVLYVSLGTGVGGALISDGQLVAGPAGSGGEISELVCADFRGRADRVENIASGTSLARYYNTLRADPRVGRIPWRAPVSGEPELPEIIHRLEEGDQLAGEIIEGNLAGLGRCLGALTSAFDLSAIIIGGGVADLGALVRDPIRRGIREAALLPNREIPVLASAINKHAPLVGAAAYAREWAVQE